MSVPCPCCGAAVQTPGLESLRFMIVPPNERRVLDALISSYPRVVSVPDLAQRVYGHDADGGPVTADNAVRVYMYRLRPKLAKYGWTAGAMKGVRDGVSLRRLAATPVNNPLTADA